MGDIMQTPQFQLRRLKVQLAFERKKQEELEVEVVETHKLVMEKGQYQHILGCKEGSGAEISPCFSDFSFVTPPQFCSCMVHPAMPQVRLQVPSSILYCLIYPGQQKL